MSEEVFDSSHDGNLPANLIEKLEHEVPKLFDYLVRMTGSISRAEGTTEEVLGLMRKVKKEVPYSEVRVALYSLARKLNKAYWNRITDKLINDGFNEDNTDKDSLQLESLLGKLDGKDREKILLKHRLNFEDEQISKVMNLPESVSMDLGSILSELGVLDGSTIKRIPNHPVPASTLYHTKALSEVMQDFDNKKRNISSLKWVVVVALGVLALGFIYLTQK